MRKAQRSTHFWVWAILTPVLILLVIWALSTRQHYPTDVIPTPTEEGR